MTTRFALAVAATSLAVMTMLSPASQAATPFVHVAGEGTTIQVQKPDRTGQTVDRHASAEDHSFDVRPDTSKTDTSRPEQPETSSTR